MRESYSGQRLLHCVACMEEMGLTRGTGIGWVENVQCLKCREIKLCEEGRKKIDDLDRFFEVIPAAVVVQIKPQGNEYTYKTRV